MISFLKRDAPVPPRPLREHLAHLEPLDARATTLAHLLVLDRHRRPRVRRLYPRFHHNARVLRKAYRLLAIDVQAGRFVTSAGEWLLDNYHVIAGEVGDIRRDLPRSYYRTLPTLAIPGLAGQARIYTLAVELVRHEDSRLERKPLATFLQSYQAVAPLTIGELWAWPSMLRLALIESLRRLADELLYTRRLRHDADDYLTAATTGRTARLPALPEDAGTTFIAQLLHRAHEFGQQFHVVREAIDAHLMGQGLTPEEAVRAEHRRQAATQVSVANALTSLRLCSRLDWREFVESISLVEQILQQDPSGAYGRMDFHSRDQQRRAVEEIVPENGEGQADVAQAALTRARQAAARLSPDHRDAHVGFHLVGPGRAALERAVGRRPPIARRVRRFVLAHPTPIYLGAILATTSVLVALGVLLVRELGAGPAMLVLVALALLFPASDVAIAVIQRFAARLIPPRRLPRLDYSDGVPADARTMVVIPTILSSPDGVAELLQHLEVIALANLEPHVHFAILGDFADAPAAHADPDGAILDAARDGIGALNARLAGDRGDRFFLFHRERRWNPSEARWMGWERKRGKIEEFNRRLRGASDTSFTTEVGRLDILPAVRYCLTLDTDTFLPRGAAARLVGIIEHPLNRPRFDVDAGRVLQGYGILQPRVSVTMASAAGSRFARLYAGHTGVDPYTTAVSDIYQDLFGEGLFSGKGLFDVDVFMAALEDRVPENALLSHDLFEGLFARTALVTDVELVDDYPSTVVAHASRHHRWMRGDWQILRWLFPQVPGRSGPRRNTLPPIARWKIFDNLRRSLVPPATLALFVLGWLVMPGPAWAWTAAGVGALSFPWLSWLFDVSRGPGRGEPLSVFARTAADDLATASARMLLQLTFLPYHAAQAVHAVVLTLIRLTWTRRRLLEWETAAAVARRAHGTRLPTFLKAMAASPLIAAGLTLAMALARPSSLSWALPVLLLWALAPVIAHALSRPAPARRVVLPARDTQLLRDVARRTWHYFETFMTDEHNGLPPDNVQFAPDQRVAHRTSPTNIAMAILAMLCAREFGFIDTAALAGRLTRLFDAIDRLPKHRGHLLNWYDTRTLEPLRPSYVSTVDSGNLAGALLTAAVALREMAGALASSGPDRRRQGYGGPPKPLAKAERPDVQGPDVPGSDLQGSDLQSLADRCEALLAGMDFRFLYSERRRLFSIGYVMPDEAGPGQLDAGHYDLLASEARLASLVAIAKGDVAEEHWFHLGRSLTSVDGSPVLLSWSGTMFEYLMPLLLTRRYPDTLLDQSCRVVVRRQIAYGRQRGVPWGVSESGYDIVDRHQTYQYKAFGVPGLGLKRGLAEELVVAPYASALAALIDPIAAAANLRRLTDSGLLGAYGFYEAIDYTRRRGLDRLDPDQPFAGGPRRGAIVQACLAHHAGMTLAALANVLLDDRLVRWFHADLRVEATEMILQERVPRQAPVAKPRPADDVRIEFQPAPEPERRFRSPETTNPHAQFLSNGNYVTVVTNGGGGYSQYQGLAVTRRRYDATRDLGSQFLYVRDVRGGGVWSATFEPTRVEPDESLVVFKPERAHFHRRDGQLSTELDIAVSSEDDVEVRRLIITNRGARAREIDVTSYLEIVMAPPSQDLAHPAFGKLFIDTERLPGLDALVARRRRRDAGDREMWAVHVLSRGGRTQGAVEWETDRMAFIGRGRDLTHPAALDGRALSGTTGLVLDPILSLRQRLRLLPGGWARLCFATGVAGDRQTAEALARKYSDFGAAVQTFLLAETREHGHRWHLSVSPEDVVRFERLASRVLHADRSLRAPRDVVAANTLGQSGLWRHGISGDLPILLVRIHKDDDVGLVRQVLQAQEYWRLKGLVADVVIVNENPSGYLDEMHGRLTELLDSGPWRGALHRPGGAFLLRGDQVSSEESCLLQTAARAVLDGARGDLRAQLDHPSGPAPHRAGLAVSTTSVAPTRPAGAPAKMPAVSFHNGLGGFAAGGRTYAIAVDAARVPPLPWSNVIANARFGTIVSERGSAFTWAGNSRENRLTPFSNDPVIDPTGEAIYVRDDATSEAWTPTPGPMRQSVEDDRVVVTHQPGLSRFERVAGGLRLTLEVFVDAQDPVKFSRLTIENLGADIRRLSVFAYNEWLLGPPQDLIQLHVKTAWDDRSRALFAENPYNEEFGTAVAFAASSPPAQAFTADRRAFIGSRRDLSRPAALDTVALSGDVGAGLDPCAALQVRLPVEPGEAQTVVFVLGQARDREAARALVARHASAAGAEAARAAQPWDDILGAIQVRTPDDSFDVLMNHWLPYQTLGCRVWARTGYHQPGGAFGFRDQLQDVLALCHSRPDIARAHIVRAAGRQFREGDVQHWWHEPSGRGLRSRCSDDLLWLPFAAADYARTTGDSSIFEERVAYLDAPLLAEGAHEAYQEPAASAESGTLFEHCLRAIDKGLTAGAHGLPLIGGGDWNDGMNRVGHAGRGESVWLGFFLFGILRDFAVLCRCRGEIDRAQRYRHEAQRLSHSLELSWDGEWYRRAYYDDGTPIGSAQSDECRIDSLAQSWAVLSDAVPRAFAERAIDAVRARLVNRAARVLPLLEPPFERTPHDPGYIKAYPPGVRENGGQYTHAAVWFIMALARLGHGDEAAELFHMLNPVNHARTREEVTQYKLEPYVMAGDVYSLPPHAGRGGWSWYTGSAGWMYRAGLESLLGFVRRGDVLRINPCVPAGWTEFGIRWRSGETTYDIAVRNPAGHAGGRTSASFDGTPVDPLAIPIVLDGGTHDVQVVLGGDD